MERNQKIIPQPSDGYCLLNSIESSITWDHGITITRQAIVKRVMENILTNSNEYLGYLTGYTVERLITECQDYFEKGAFTKSVVDVLVLACANALNLKINVHQRSPADTIQITRISGDTPLMEINVVFHTSQGTGDYTGANHYEAVVNIDSPIRPNTQDSEPVEITLPTQSDSLFEDDSDFSVPIPGENSNLLVLSHNRSWIIEDSLRPGTKFPTFLFSAITPKNVNYIPANINGNRVFKVNCTPRNYSKNCGDRRWFNMVTSTKDKRMIKKIGFCQGSWKCVNPNCSFLSTEKKENKWHFVYRHGAKACYSCKPPAIQEPCNAKKLIEMEKSSTYAMVYHIGHHTCELQPDVQSDVQYTKKWVEKFPGQSFKSMKTSVITQLIDENRLEEAETAAYRLSARAYRSVKKEIRNEFNPEEVSTQSLEAVQILKEKSDGLDKFYIFRINSKGMNGKPDFVMKSSTLSMKLALQLDIDGPQNEFQNQDVFFDGSHSRCNGFVSLGLWTQHPSKRSFIRLASMEVRTEKTEDIVLFWEMINEMLQLLKKDGNYKFNPKTIFCDSAGANFAAIAKVFGQGFIDTGRVVTCRWHFMDNINKRRHLMEEDDQQEFHDSCEALCKAKTVPEYDLLYSHIMDILIKYPQAANCLEWHHARRGALFPAFRDGRHAGVNLAEVGNSQWKPKHKLSLVTAAKDDIGTMMSLEAELKRFNLGETFTPGRVPSDAERATQEKQFQCEQARSFGDMLTNEAARRIQMDSEACPPTFVPQASCSHKPGNSSGIQGHYVLSKKGVKRGQGRGRGSRGRGKPKGSERHTPIPLNNLLEKLTTARRISTGTLSPPPQPILSPSTDGLPVLGSGPERRPVRPIPSTPSNPNPPIIVHSLFNIKICQGCPNPIDTASMRPPTDMLFRLKGIRPYRDPHTKMYHDRIQNIYFHLNEQCLKNFDCRIDMKDITMTDELFCSVSVDHLHKLQSLGFLDYIIKNKVNFSAN